MNRKKTDEAAPLQPFIDVISINLMVAKKINELQSNLISDLIDANIKQLTKVSETKTLTSVLDQNIAFYNEIDNKLKSAAEQEIETARNAQKSINVIIEKTVSTPDSTTQDTN